MADLNVQPKRNSNWWVWLLVAIILIALIYFLSKGCNKESTVATNTTQDTTTTQTDTAETFSSPNGYNEWSNIDFNASDANYSEITDKDISVRGNDQYAIYSLGNNILFDVDRNTIRKDGQTKLKQIAASLNQRYKDGNIRIYGRTDSTGDAAQNKQLALDRANAVKSWLQQNGIPGDHISVHPLGESQPVSSNATESGRQQNRSVQIVAKKR